MMNVEIKILVLASCLLQTPARPVNRGALEILPFDSYGDLNMPGFNELNDAINFGTLDVAPSLATMPSYPKQSLSDVISQVLGTLASSSLVRGDIRIANSLKSLQKISSDFEELALVYNRMSESWDMVDAIKSYSWTTIELRSQLENSVEVVQGAVKPMIAGLRDLVMNLGSEPEVIQVQHDVDDLIEKFDVHFGQHVSDTAKILHDIQRFLSAVLNYRVLVPQQLRALTVSIAQQRMNLKNAITSFAAEVSIVEEKLQNLLKTGIIESYELMQIASSAKQINALLSREIEKMSSASTSMAIAAKDVYVALQSFAF